ncbi:hypothetical protein SUGI_1486130 [Cryptomeria japonica]|uniref:Uncharacterized protein n=1 Tax=Cryptomeria japonica TaxID=3369 RepID=A0AAD3NSM8_CRYJA|nr:hypothetical protein SUGI_1486130 [Cryptomeria japonica]
MVGGRERYPACPQPSPPGGGWMELAEEHDPCTAPYLTKHSLRKEGRSNHLPLPADEGGRKQGWSRIAGKMKSMQNEEP